MRFNYYKTKKRKKYNDLLPFTLFRFHRLFFGSLISRGRKLWAYNFMIKFRQGIKLKEKIEFYFVFIFALSKIIPTVLLYPLKIGGVKQGVPLFISFKKKFTFTVKWILMSLRQKFKRIKLIDLVTEFHNLIYDKGISLKKKRRTYIEGFSNRFLLKRFKYRG